MEASLGIATTRRIEFGQRLADQTRLNYVAIEREKGVMAATKRVSERRQAERVVPIKRGKKK